MTAGAGSLTPWTPTITCAALGAPRAAVGGRQPHAAFAAAVCLPSPPSDGPTRPTSLCLLRQSLLNGRQSKWAKELLRNVRLSCCVAGVLNLVVKVGGAWLCAASFVRLART